MEMPFSPSVDTTKLDVDKDQTCNPVCDRHVGIRLALHHPSGPARIWARPFFAQLTV